MKRLEKGKDTKKIPSAAESSHTPEEEAREKRPSKADHHKKESSSVTEQGASPAERPGRPAARSDKLKILAAGDSGTHVPGRPAARSDKLKILAAGDLHGDRGLAEELAERAEREHVDLVILCGDLTYREESTEGIIGPFVKRGEKVLLIPGNHETIATADFLAELYDAKNIHGYSVRYKDVGIFGAGGANIGLFQIPEGEMYDLLKKGHEGIEGLKKTIMVTHVHPSGSKMERFTKFFPGSTGVRKAIDRFRPNVLLCSHVHEAEGIEELIGGTKVINVGRKGKILEL